MLLRYNGKKVERIMDEKITLRINEEDVTRKSSMNNRAKKRERGREYTDQKKWSILLTIGILMFLGGTGCFLGGILKPQEEASKYDFPEVGKKQTDPDSVYSSLTGEKLSDTSLANAPTYCIQTPNGTDGARPQSGLNTAGVVFEAIAEAGITRFAAIYQGPTAAVIGPIRSLRLYYLEWDTPFDCAIVHAGGADDALKAVASGGYKDLTENYTYMYRGTYGARRWNNLFTTSNYLKQYSTNTNSSSSNVKGFSRMTPEESQKSRVDKLIKEPLNITKPASGNTSETEIKAQDISFRFGGIPSFNVHYSYDTESNKYFRSYESGLAHEVYNCPTEDLGEKNPEDACSLVQMAPSVVIAMVVQERKAWDNYHEDIDTIGSGDAYIFQNGDAIKGTWAKATREDQIKFLDEDGKEVKLAPGQTIVSAIPAYGSVAF